MTTVVVRLLGVPVRDWLRLQEHTDALLREHRLMTQQGTVRVPPELLALFDAARAAFPESAVPGLRAGVKTAAEAGRVAADVEAVVTPRQADVMVALHGHLCEIDAYCRRGVLLTLPLDEEFVALRSWAVTEVCRQINGEPPRPWPGSRG